MKKKLLVMFAMATCLLAGCANEQESKTEEKKAVTEDSEKKEDDKTTVIWKVSAETNIFADNVELLNQELENRGYDFKVEFQNMEAAYADGYEAAVKKELEEGTTDIINVGSETSENCFGIDGVFRDGCLASWNEYFQTEEGKKLYKQYPKKVWKVLELAGEIYSLPNESMIYGDSYVAFNLNYISKEAAENWDGKLESLYKLADSVNTDDAIIPIYMAADMENLINETGNYMQNGILINPAKKKAENPYKNKSVLKLFHVIKEGYDKNLFQSTFSLSDTSEYDEEVEAKFENKQYAICYGTEKGSDENFYYAKLPFMPVSSLSLTIGVCDKSEQKEEAFQLLSVLRTDDELANLLIWGEENTTYTLTDGVAARTDEKRVMAQRLMTGLCDGIYPEEKWAYEDRRQYKKELLKNSATITNPLLGFQLNTDGLQEALSVSYQSFVTNLDCFKEKEMKGKISKIAKAWQKENGTLLKKLQKQLDAYHKVK